MVIYFYTYVRLFTFIFFHHLLMYFRVCVLYSQVNPRRLLAINQLDTLNFYQGIFQWMWSSFILNYPSNMPALTRKAKRRHFDSLDKEDGSDNEGVVGVLAQCAARRQAAREEPQQQQVHFMTSSCLSCIDH